MRERLLAKDSRDVIRSQGQGKEEKGGTVGQGELYIRLAYSELSLRSGGLTNSSISGLLCVIFFFLTVREPFRSFVKTHIVYISHSYTHLYVCMYVWVRLKHVYKPFPHVFFSVLSRLSDSDSLLLLNYLLPVSSSTVPNVCTTTLGNSVTLYEGTAPCQHRHIDKYKKCARLYWDLLPRILGPLDPGFLLILLTILVSAIKIGARLNGSSINIFEAAPPAGKGRKRSRIS